MKLFAVFALLIASSASALEFRCPEKIETTQKLSKAIKGWAARTDSDANLYENFGIYSGHPREGASLVPADSGDTKFWTYDQENGLWMQCRYRGTFVTLEIEIPKSSKKCSTKMAPDKQSYLSLICE